LSTSGTGADRSQGDSFGSKALKGALSNYAGKGLILVLGFLLTPFILHRLGRTDYGLWVLVGPIVTYGTLLDLGISSTLTKHVAEYEAKGKLLDTGDMLASALRLYLMLALVTLLLSAVVAVIAPQFLHVPISHRTSASWVFFLAGCGVAVSLPGALPSAVLRGLHRFDLTNLLAVSGTLVALVATLIVLALGGGVVGMVALTAPLRLVLPIPAVWLVHRIAPDLRVRWRAGAHTNLRAMASSTASVFAIQVAARFQTETDELVIGAFRPLSDITPFSLAARVGGIANLVADQFVQVLLPLASALHAENDRQRMRDLYVTSTRVTLAIAVPIAGVLIVLAAPILSAWVGPQYAPYSYLVAILGVALVIDTSITPAGSVLQAMDRLRPVAIASMCSGVANLLLSITLVHFIGLAGVAFGTLIPTTVECLGFVLIYTMRVLDIGFRDVITEIFLPVAAPAVPVLASLALVVPHVQGWSFLEIIALSGVVVGVYGVIYLVTGASNLERQTCLGTLRGMARSAVAHTR